MKNNQQQPFLMEITVISAQGLKNSRTTTTTTSSFFSHRRLRPFITITTVPQNNIIINRNKHRHVYQTRVCDDDGEQGLNPTWGDKFYLPLDATFSVYLQIYTKRLMTGKSQLGWCQIPITDILDGLSPVGPIRYLSYRLRDKDGSRSHGVVNIAVRLLQGQVLAAEEANNRTKSPENGVDGTVIGIPVSIFPVTCQGQLGVTSCKEEERATSGRQGKCSPRVCGMHAPINGEQYPVRQAKDLHLCVTLNRSHDP